MSAKPTGPTKGSVDAKALKPLSTARATERIRALASNYETVFTWTDHAKDQMAERNLFMSDLLHMMRSGFVHNEPLESTRPGCFRYLIEGTTPNSNGRKVAVSVIMSSNLNKKELKIVTVMWRDENR